MCAGHPCAAEPSKRFRHADTRLNGGNGYYDSG